MANCANSTSTPTASRRRFGAGLLAVMAGSVITSGVAAGTAASVGDLIPAEVEPDGALLSMRADLLAAVADVGWFEMDDEWSDERISQAGKRLNDVCWEIVQAPPPQTAAGRALKAAGVMYQLRDGYSGGGWPGQGEAMAWDVLSQIAGDAYVSPALPERLRASCEPARA